MRNLILALVGVVALLTPAAVGAQPAAGAADGVRMEIFALPADPPGRQLKAVGGGRELLPVILFTPPGGPNIYAPAIVVLDQGPGSNPAKGDQPTNFAARRLAAKGYTVLSIYSRLERSYPLHRFSQIRYDIKAAVDLLESRGYEDVVLMARGYTAVAAADYLANIDDASRVKAAVLWAPLLDVRNYPELGLGKAAYDKRVSEAKAYLAKGMGRMNPDPQPGGGVPQAEAPWIMTGRYAMPQEAFLEYFGPEAQARNLELLAKLDRPTLLIGGAGDPSSPTAGLQQIKSAAPGPVDVVTYPQSPFETEAAQDKAVSDVADWLARQKLPVRPGVEVTFASVKAEDGRVLGGVLYSPKLPADPNRPAFVLLHGLSEDPIHSSTHWLGWRVAQLGYTALAVQTHASGLEGATISGNLADVASDIGIWNDLMNRMGHKRLVLTGHSMGGVQISNYIGLSKDPRVIGAVYLAPTVDRPEPQTPEYLAAVKEAKAAVARGEARTHTMGIDKLRAAGYWLDWHGPESRMRHFQRIKEVPQPILVIAGAKDPLMQIPGFLDTFMASHEGPEVLKLYPNGTHGLKESKNQIQADIGEWMKATFGQ
jgi:alpha-beta hydrolase superfamily lysophospholipase